MTGKTHLAAGVLAGALTARHLGLDTVNTTGVMAISGMAALFPDIDTANSVIGLKVRPLSALINHIFGHRKLFHAPLVYLALGVALYSALPLKLFLSIAGGVLSHLLLDSITRRGIPWLYPFRREAFGITPIGAGGIVDKLLRYGFAGFTLYIVSLNI